jgi:hypothetical protein
MTLAQNGTWSPITQAQVRAGIVALWKAAYGANADTDPNTPDGLEITIIANQLSLAFDVDTRIWANSFFRSAEGTALDRILDLFGKTRDPATSSTASEIFYGTPGTPVPIGTTVITTDAAANSFTTEAAAVVGAASNSDAWVVRIKNASVGDLYAVQVDANPALGYVAAPLDTPLLIAQDLRDQVNGQGFATAALAGTDASGFALLAIEVIGGPGNVATTFTGAALLDDLEAVRVDVTATATGQTLAAAGTLQTISNPIVGITGATNDADATPGVDVQSDDDFRAAHLETLFANAARTDSGLRAAVQRVPDMIEVGVTSNRTTAPVDAFGRPIHSVEVVFLAEDGVDVDQLVANAIASQLVAGIQPYGLASMGLGVTEDGEIVEIFATPVERLYLHLQITLTPGESFPTAGDTAAAVATATANYFDSGLITTAAGQTTDINAKLITGKDMLRTACNTPINSVTNNGAAIIGILTDVTLTPGGVPVFGATDQVASPRQIIRADASRITVVII